MPTLAFRRCTLPVLMLSACAPALAQANRRANDAAGCAACGGLLGFFIVLIILNIAMLVWVARDAKARGMDGSILWMLLVFFFSLPGLLIYILSRPKGDLIVCPNCRNKRLASSLVCPHCGAGR